ncbi:hypothetical protein Emag_000007 [Eimeria magna]
MTNATRCPESSYCPEGSVAPQLCPVGTYSVKTSLQDASQCTSCPEVDTDLVALHQHDESPWYLTASWCADHLQEQSGPNQICPEGFYCTAGSSNPEPCPEGTYSPSRQAISSAACLPCDPGMGARDQVPYRKRVPSWIGCSDSLQACKHTTRAHEAASPFDDYIIQFLLFFDCFARQGTFSDAEGAAQCQECPEGYFCEDSSLLPGEAQKCPSGFFCPPGTAFSEEYPCPQGKNYRACLHRIHDGHRNVHSISRTLRDSAHVGQSKSRTECSTGCTMSEDAPRTWYSVCAPLFAFPTLWPKTGTLRKKPGATSLDDCEPCPAGKYCTGPGAKDETGDIAGGYYSSSGATSSKPHQGVETIVKRETTVRIFFTQSTALLEEFANQGPSAQAVLKLLLSAQLESIALNTPYPPLPGTALLDTLAPRVSQNLAKEQRPVSLEVHRLWRKVKRWFPSLPAPNPRCHATGCSTGAALQKMTVCSAHRASIVTHGASQFRRVLAQQDAVCLNEQELIVGREPLIPKTQPHVNLVTCALKAHPLLCRVLQEPSSRLVGKQVANRVPLGTEWREPTTFCKHGEYCPPGSKAPLDCPPNHFCNTVKLIEPSGPCNAGFICISRSTTPRPTGNEAGAACEENMNGRPCKKGHYCPAPASPLIAGTGFGGTGGEGLPASQSYLMLPSNTVMDPETRDIYIADFRNFAIKRVSGATGRNAVVKYDVISSSFSIVGPISSIASKPLGLALDTSCSHLYVADSANHRVLKYTLDAATVDTIAGQDANKQISPDQLNSPSGVAISDNLLYIADTGNRRIVEVDVRQPQISRIVAGEGALALEAVNQLPFVEQEASEITLKMPVSVALADDQGEIVLVISDAKARADEGLAEPQGPCDAGYYCPPGSTEPTAEECSPGHYCIAHTELTDVTTDLEAASMASTATSGWFRNAAKTAYRSTAGMKKPLCLVDEHNQEVLALELEKPMDLTKIRIDSELNQPPENNSIGFAKCDATFLFSGPVTQKKCPAGTFQPDAGATQCTTCPAGHYCDEFGLVQPKECRAGFYCPAGSFQMAPFYCKLGWISVNAGASSDIGCEPCKAGHFCATRGGTEPTGVCAAGYYCTGGSWTPTPAAEMLHPDTGEIVNVGDICPPKTFCTQGASEPEPCPAGTFSEELGLVSEDACTVCAPGFGCVSAGVQHPCAAGYFCLEGSDTSEPSDENKGGQCPAGSFCPEGAFAPRVPLRVKLPAHHAALVNTATSPGGQRMANFVLRDTTALRKRLHRSLVDPGHFKTKQDNTSASHAQGDIIVPAIELHRLAGNATLETCEGNNSPTGDCAAGYVCTGGASSPTPSDETGSACPAGWFCLEGATHPLPCAPGTYTSEPGQDSCKLCPAGFYCDEPGEGPKSCPKGKSCPEGSAQPDLCQLGSVANFTAEDEANSCLPCPYGKYCRGGVEAGDCLPGFLCGLGNWVPNPWSEKASNEPYIPKSAREAGSVTMLSAENWSTVGQTAYGGIPCPPGHYCPAGTTEPEPCPDGSVRQDNFGRWESDCSICPKGFYCPSLSLTPKACPIGHFCPLGSTEPTPCFAGTFNPHEEGGDTSACLACIRGYICAVEGVGELAFDQQCPAGHYCLEGSISPIPCPPGAYTEERGRSRESECSLCPGATK